MKILLTVKYFIVSEIDSPLAVVDPRASVECVFRMRQDLIFNLLSAGSRQKPATMGRLVDWAHG